MSSAAECSISRSVFKRCVRGYLDSTGRTNITVSKDAMHVLQKDIESRLVEVYTNAFQMSVEAKRQTLKIEDFRSALEEFNQQNNNYRPQIEEEDGG